MRTLLVAFCTSATLLTSGYAQEATAPFTEAEREEIYARTIGKRVDAILGDLKIGDTNKAERVRTVIATQYRSLRARDEAVDNLFNSLSRNAPGVESNRHAVVKLLSKQLHEQFISKLSADLSAAEIEAVKDRMTYNKVRVTYDAYCQIVPNLSADEKAMILEQLKAAREDAIDGGSADEKAAIFQIYKDRINAKLKTGGHDVEAATKAWEAKQQASAKP